MRVLAVTPWEGQGTPSGQSCGIANYAALLQAHLPADIELVPEHKALDPMYCVGYLSNAFDVIWVNHHRGLHSRWTSETVGMIQYRLRRPVVVTFHDTYGEREPDSLTADLCTAADAFVVHEPCVGLPQAEVIRQGVIARRGWMQYTSRTPLAHGNEYYFLDYDGQPILGTFGFNFPWKNFDRLAQATKDAGWAYLVVSNNATEEDLRRWQAVNPATTLFSGHRSASEVVSLLAGCDATAFPYECANSGTSGAIRLGIAARKPVLAFLHCRQFRDLLDEPAICWCEEWRELGGLLTTLPIQRIDTGIVALAAKDSWTTQGARYAEIFRRVAAAAAAP